MKLFGVIQKLKTQTVTGQLLELVEDDEFHLAVIYICLIISDVNECLHSLHNCHAEAHCNNILGSFTCTCNPGWSGDGVSCTGQ